MPITSLTTDKLRPGQNESHVEKTFAIQLFNAPASTKQLGFVPVPQSEHHAIVEPGAQCKGGP